MTPETESQQTLAEEKRIVGAEAKKPEVENDVMDGRSRTEKSGPTVGQRADPQRVSKRSANGRQEEHSQLQARTSQGRTVAADKPKGSSLRKGRSQDTVREVTRIEDAYEDKREDNANESVPAIVSTRTLTAVNLCKQFHVEDHFAKAKEQVADGAFVNVNDSITDLINRLQTKAASETRHKPTVVKRCRVLQRVILPRM